MNFREMTKEQLAEESLIDLAFAILEEKKAAIPFEELVKLIQGLNGLSDEEMKSRLVQFYTDMNVDGRFLLENEKGWGLREWYKVEQIEEETAPSVKIRKKKSKAAVEDEELEELEDELEEDLGFEEDFEEDFDEFVEEDEDEEEVEDLDDIEFDEEEVIDDIEEDLDEELIDEEDEFELEEDELDEEIID